MKSLILSYPYLDGTGGGVFATRAFSNAVCKLSDSCVMMCKQKPGVGPEGLDDAIEVIPYIENRPKPVRLVRTLLGILHPFAKGFRQTLSEYDIDTVFFASSIASFRLVKAAKKAGCRTVVLHQNFEKEYYSDNFTGIIRSLMLFWVRRFESRAVHECDLNLVLTESDAKSLRKEYSADSARFEVLGIFEQSPKDLPQITTIHTAGRFIITGTLSAMQTYRSLDSWMKKYYDILKQECPDMSLVVAGRDPSVELSSMLDSMGCTVVPSPENMDAVIADASCYICPVDLGGGLKLRIMDGLRNGLPVITHEVSLRGYERFSGSCVFGYHDEPTFREAVRKSMACELSAGQIRDAYSSFFSFAAGTARLESILER